MPVPVEERELNELDEQIEDLAGRERTEREQADQTLARIREEGRNPATDSDAFDEVDQAYRAADGTREELAQLRDRRARLSARNQPTPTDRPQDNRPGGPGHIARSITAEMARRFVESDELAALMRRGVVGAGNGSTYASDAVEVLSREELRSFLAATVDGTPLIPEDQRLFPPVGIPVRSIRLLDLITIGTTDSDTVKWVEETTRTDAAAETAKGVLVPESTYVYVQRTAEVKRIAHFLPAHEDEMKDQGQLQTLLESRLATGVRLRAERQALAGDGTGENWTGILNTAGISDQAKGADPVPDAIHKGITLVRVSAEKDPTAVGLHPNDWERYLLAKDANGNYLHGNGTLGGSVMTAWGLPAVVSSVFTEGEAVVADWADATLWVREGVTTQATNAFEDFFRKYMVAMRSGFRGAFAVAQKKSFATVSGLNA